MTGRRVPFGRRAETRIEIGAAFGDDAELEAGANGLIAAARRRQRDIIRRILGEMRLGGDDDRRLRTGAARNDLAPLPFVEPGMAAGDAAMQPARRRREDDAEARGLVHDQSDVDGVIVAAADKLLGAVERVDQEERAGVGRDASRRDFLLGDDRHARGGPGQSGEDDQFGGAVGLGDRR